mmetsp:Transcript_35515/g.76680  ORF Transcript_35515/g.76680 Transcript_35515/m.76680 type:complete len:217 (+) Transcript_35515:319-969(+)
MVFLLLLLLLLFLLAWMLHCWRPLLLPPLQGGCRCCGGQCAGPKGSQLELKVHDQQQLLQLRFPPKVPGFHRPRLHHPSLRRGLPQQAAGPVAEEEASDCGRGLCCCCSPRSSHWGFCPPTASSRRLLRQCSSTRLGPGAWEGGGRGGGFGGGRRPPTRIQDQPTTGRHSDCHQRPWPDLRRGHPERHISAWHSHFRRRASHQRRLSQRKGCLERQ